MSHDTMWVSGKHGALPQLIDLYSLVQTIIKLFSPHITLRLSTLLKLPEREGTGGKEREREQERARERVTGRGLV